MKNNRLTSNWWREAIYFIRYSGAGLINTIVGVIVIFSAMALGFSPTISNMAGYAVGFFLGFVLSKKFVFLSNGHFASESLRYLIAFSISYLCNIFVLHLAISTFNIHPAISQLAASATYTLLMYILSSLFVFRSIKNIPKNHTTVN